MADERLPPSRGRRAQAIGAVALVVVAFAIAMKLRARHGETEDRLGADAGDALASGVPRETEAPSTSAPSVPAPRSLVHYVSALLPKGASVLGLSSGTGTALAVGDHGAIFRFELDHPSWTAEPRVTDRTLRSVAQRLDRAVAVGDDGTIVELEGGKWSLAPVVTSRTLRAVVYSSYGVIAGGDAGTIVTQSGEGQPWRAVPSGTTSDLLGACAGLRDVWAVGRAGTTMLRGPDGWRSLPPTGASALYAVACDDRSGIAVGEKGTILERMDDVGWHATPSGTDADLFAVSAPVGTKSYLVVGSAGTILHVTNDVTAEPQAFTFTLRAATDGALGTWVGGDEGLLRRATN